MSGLLEIVRMLHHLLLNVDVILLRKLNLYSILSDT